MVFNASIVSHLVHAVLGWGIALSGIVGLIALLHPRLFMLLADQSSRWCDFDSWIRILDKRVDIDHFVLPYTRWLGLATLLGMCWIGYVLFVR